MTWIEALGATIALVMQVLAVRRSRWVFIATMVNALIYGAVFISARLFASMSLQALFFFLACYGLWYWKKGLDGAAVPIARFGWLKTIASITVIALVMLAAASALKAYTTARPPYADTTAAGLSVLGELLLSRKKIETWVVFAVAYGFAIYAYLTSGLIFTAALCGVLLSLCVIGWLSWHKELTTGAKIGSA